MRGSRRMLNAAKVLIALAYHLGATAAGLAARLLGRPLPGPAVVLTYHGVGPGLRASFARQLDALLEAGVPVEISLCEDAPDGSRRIALTFDDAYETFRRNALPELEARRMPATLFVPTALLGRPAEWSENARRSGERVMTADEVRGLFGRVVGVGSHTRLHRRLTGLGDREKVEEIAGSKAELEALLGAEVSLLAFPFNDWDDRCLEIAREAGYRRAYANVPLSPGGPGGILRGRVDVTPEDWRLEFWLKVRGAYRWLPPAARLKRRLESLRGGRERA